MAPPNYPLLLFGAVAVVVALGLLYWMGNRISSTSPKSVPIVVVLISVWLVISLVAAAKLYKTCEKNRCQYARQCKLLSFPRRTTAAASSAAGSSRRRAVDAHPSSSSYRGMALSDGQASIACKLRILAAARRHVIWSFNYVGGECCEQTLRLIRRKCRDDGVRFQLMVSKTFLSRRNHRHLLSLCADFPNHVHLVFTEEQYRMVSSDDVLLLNNHAKMMCVDFGQVLVIGGCGMEDAYNLSGIDALEIPLEGTAGIGLPSAARTQVPTGFRDMDWVFWADAAADNVDCGEPSEAISNGRGGEEVFAHMQQLFAYWAAEPSNDYKAPSWTDAKKLLPMSSFSASHLSLLSEYWSGVVVCSSPSSSSNGLQQCHQDKFPLCTPRFHLLFCNTKPSSSSSSSVSLYGRRSAFHDILCARIAAAQRSIWIAHIFIHLTPELSRALCAAVARGVSVTIISNGCHQLDPPEDDESVQTPGGHRFYVPRSRAECSKLCAASTEDGGGGLRVFEFAISRCSYHKKVVVVDEVWVVAGNSNLGDKSLRTQADHEFNVEVESPHLARATLAVLQTDLRYCKRVFPAQTTKKENNVDASVSLWSSQSLDWLHRNMLSMWIG